MPRKMPETYLTFSRADFLSGLDFGDSRGSSYNPRLVVTAKPAIISASPE